MLQKLSTIFLLILVIFLFLIVWQFPEIGGILGIIVLFLGFIVNLYGLVKKHREEYRQGKITRAVFWRKIIVETIGILIAMVLAVLVAKRVLTLVTHDIVNTITRFIASVLIAFMVGIGVGLVFKKFWDGVQKRVVG